MVSYIDNRSGFRGYQFDPSKGIFASPTYTGNTRIPLQNNATMSVGMGNNRGTGRSYLDNVYGLSTNPNIQANPPSVFRTKNAINRGMFDNRFSALPKQQAGFSSLGQQQNAMGLVPKPVNQSANVPSNRQPPLAVANNMMNNQKPSTVKKVGQGLLDFASSPYGSGFAQGLLNASAYSPMPVSFGQALGQAMAEADKSVDRDYQKEQDKFLNELKSREDSRTQEKFDKEMSLLDQSILDNEQVKGILKDTRMSDFDSDRDYYRSVGNELLKLGKINEAKEFMALAQPKSMTDLRKDIVSANKEEGKVYKDVKDAIVNYQGLQAALRGSDGSSAYATMIKFIKGLDNSVVREGEVRSFENFQGVYNKLKIEIDKAQGKGFPPETKSTIANLSNETFTALIEDYKNYQQQKSEGIYGQLGMSPELIFSGYDTSSIESELNKSYTAEDFSTQAMYDQFGQLGDVKRRFKDKSDEEITEYIKTADPLEVQHFINLGFVDQ